MSLFFLLLGLLSGTTACNGQEIFYHNYTVKDGLAGNKIYNIIEDRLGFIWIATEQGVSRYDGVRFVSFTTKEGLAHNDVLGLYEDGAGRIWFHCFGTEPCYYLNGKIYHAQNDTLIRRVRTGMRSESGMPVIAVEDSAMYFYIEEHGKPLLISHGKPDIHVNKTAAMHTPESISYLFRNNRRYFLLNSFILASWDDTHPLKNVSPKSWGRTQYIYGQTPAGELYGLDVTSQCIRRITPSGKYNSFPIRPEWKSLFSTNSTHALLGENRCLVLNKDWTSVIDSFSFPFPAKTVLIDRKGNKWFGTYDRGLFLIRSNAPVRYSLPEQVQGGILSAEPIGKYLYLKTENQGLIQIDSQGNHLYMFIPRGSRRIVGVAQVGNYLISGGDDGLYQVDPRTLKSILIKKYAVKDVETGLAGELLFGFAHGAAIYRHHPKDSFLRIHNQRSTAICRISRNAIWIGGLKGMWEYVPTQGRTSALTLHPLLDNCHIADIKTDRLGNIWVATYQHGLFLVEAHGRVRRIHETNALKQERLSSDICRQILISPDGNTWIVTAAGISLIKPVIQGSPAAFDVQNYAVADGLPGNQVNGMAIWNGRLMLTTPDGLFRLNTLPRPVDESKETQITQVKVNGAVQDPADIRLAYDQNNITISYVSSFINSGGAYRFLYRVKALSESWIETRSLDVTLLGLNPGEYLFEIAAVNQKGTIGKISSIPFVITRPWFKSLSFVLLLGAVILGAVTYYLVLIRDRLTLSRNNALMRLRILRAQLNPHFLFNALSNIQNLVRTRRLESANDYLGTMGFIMRSSIEYSSEELITLQQELDYTGSYLRMEKLRFDDRFDFNMEVRGFAEEVSALLVPPLLLQPLVENSIKHGFKGAAYKGLINILIEKRAPATIQYTIRDNGAGFDPEQVSWKSYGLGITRERIGILYKGMKQKASFTINSTQRDDGTGGTQIIIQLPVIRD